MRKSLALSLLCFWFAAPASANQAVQQQIPNIQKVGEARLTYAFWDVYDAVLYAPNGSWDAEKPYALSLRYLRELDGDAIADRSVEEIKKQGFTQEKSLAEWHKQMLEIFPDVKEGTNLTAIFTSNKTTLFFHDGKPIGMVKDPLFGKHFFGIWLSKKTSEPALRKSLLGLK